MKNIQLPWKSFNVNLPKIHEDLKALYPQILGTSADYQLTIHCEDEMLDEDVEAIKAYWEALTEESVEATSYKSNEQLKAEQEATKQANIESAKAKLSLLGLTEAEISALIGV